MGIIADFSDYLGEILLLLIVVGAYWLISGLRMPPSFYERDRQRRDQKIILRQNRRITSGK